jgi:glycosyltransferase involved in cell wall biosynthesis
LAADWLILCSKNFMHIAIVHYHLHPGGVTRIIDHQVNSLHNCGYPYELEVCCGDIQGKENLNTKGIHLFEEEAVQYLTEDVTPEILQSGLRKITGFLEKIAERNEIIHLHNLNLGKNPLLTLAVHRMLKGGIRIINHCHDFAEDRPKNWAFLKSVIEDYFHENLMDVLYPLSDNCQYIILTSKDQQRLIRYGVDEDKISLLPNPVGFFPATSGHISQQTVAKKLGIPSDLPICLYPVRAIKRKNIGEFILLSVIFRDEASWLITQPPQNQAEKAGYEKWKRFCLHRQIRVVFEAGVKVDIAALLSVSDRCISTSMMEGFGLVFLEPWMAGVPVIGRNIDNCTNDLITNGIRFPLLYDRFIVTFRGEKVDFGDLDQEKQQEVIEEIMTRPSRIRELKAFNPFLEELLKPVLPDIVSHNRNIIRNRYSIENYGHQLHEIYTKLSGRS